MTPRRLNAVVCALAALSAGVAFNVTFLQRGTAANWAVRGAVQLDERGANTAARGESSADPSGGTQNLRRSSPISDDGGHDGRLNGRRANAIPSSQLGSTAGHGGPIGEGATFSESNAVEVIRAVQRELGRRGYKPGIPNGEANVATRSAIVAYQDDHGLPLTGEPSDALLKAIVFDNSGAVRAPGNSVGTARDDLEAPIRLGSGGHDDRLIGGRTNTPPSPEPGSTSVGDVGPIGEGAIFSESNGVDVIRAVQRELGRRGYNPGIPNGEANVATRSAIMAYQHDHGLPLTGEPSNALLKVIVFESAGAVRAADYPIGTAQEHNEAAIVQTAPKTHSPTLRAGQRTQRGASDRCAGADRQPSRSTCNTTSQARAKPTDGLRGPSARVAIDAAHLSNGWSASPLVYGWQMITGSTSAPRSTTSARLRKMSEQKPLKVAVGSSRFESQIWAQLEQIR